MGEECITKILDMADFEIKKTSKRQKKQKMLRSVKCANTMGNLLPKVGQLTFSAILWVFILGPADNPAESM